MIKIEPIKYSKAKILIVDDDPNKIQAIESIIMDKKIEIHKASSGIEALRYCLKNDYAAIILDVNMPGLDGFETAKIIRERPLSRNLPIIFVTSYKKSELDTLKGYSLGATDYIYTPINPEILKAKIETFVSLYEKTEEAKSRAAELETANLKLEEQLVENKKLQESLLNVNKELERQREIAIEESNIKSIFLAKMSHEIRTPIHSIIGFSELLKGKVHDDDTIRYVGIINRSAKSLLGMINDILDISKIESGKMELETIEFDPIVEMESVVDMFSYKTSEKHIKFYVFIDPNLPDTIIGDPLRLKQVLINLLGNAVKFTNAGGKITMEIRLNKMDGQSCHVQFSVEDTGIGIADDKIPSLFSPFQQGAVSTFRMFGGTGLGLFISNQLIEKMGGKIEVISREGKGSRFYFSIDFNNGVESKTEKIKNDIGDIYVGVFCPEHEKKPNEQIEYLIRYLKEMKIHYRFVRKIEDNGKCDIIFAAFSQFEQNEILNIITNSKAKDEKNKEKEKPFIVIMDNENIHIQMEKIPLSIYLLEPPITFSKIFDTIVTIKFGKIRNIYSSVYGRQSYFSEKPILIVDDNELNLELFELILRQMGLKSEKAFDGKEAIENVKKQEYSMIFLDANMPVMDGVEAAKLINEIEKNKGRKHTPLIVLTAQAMKGDREHFLSSGFDEYLSKPIENNDLLKLLGKYLIKIDSIMDYEKDTIKNKKLDFVKNAESVGIEYSSYIKLAEKFSEKMVKNIEKLEELAKAGDFESIFQLAHQIKGVAINYRFEKISQIASELQDLSIDKNRDSVGKKILQMKEESLDLAEQMKGD